MHVWLLAARECVPGSVPMHQLHLLEGEPLQIGVGPEAVLPMCNTASVDGYKIDVQGVLKWATSSV